VWDIPADGRGPAAKASLRRIDPTGARRARLQPAPAPRAKMRSHHRLAVRGSRMTTSWEGQLEQAATPAEVIAIARDYLALLAPEEIVLLPVDARPRRVRDADDLAEIHERLVEAYQRTRASGAELALLQRLASFFARATARLSDLAAGASGSRTAARDGV